ncbi:MAG: hypothetical protein ABW104_16660 [Candidatus Thiodiazotropha sp. 6PLUC2]
MKQKLKTVLKSIWWLMVITFITLFLYKNLQTAASVIQKLPVTTLFIAFSSIVVAKFFLVQAMYLALQRYQVNLTYFRCFIIYNVTQLGKYIPGSIWQFVGRISFYREENISNDKIRDTLLLETFWVVFSALAIGLCLILLVQHQLLIQLLSDLPGPLTHPYTSLTLAGLIVLITLLFKKTLIKYAKRFMFSPGITLVVSIIWICLGFSFWITLLPFTSNELSFVYIIGLYALSYALGFAVPFAPAGIGIREAVLVMGLLPYLDANTSIILATINRLFYIVSEIFLVLISSYLSVRYTKESKTT